jgi:signal transduction histidine kinase
MSVREPVEKQKPFQHLSDKKDPKRWVRYVVAVAMVPLATAARLGLDRLLGQDLQPYATFYLLVALIGWWAGRGPAVVTLILGLISCLWVIVPPRNSLMIRGLPDVAEIIIYLFVTVTIVWLIHSLRQARNRAEEEHAAVSRSRAELERLVDERTAELRQRVADLQHLSYSLVHDLRAPLRAMQMFSEILVTKPSPVSEAKRDEYLERIRTAARRMDLLVNDALDYNRVALENLPLHMVDLEGLVRSLVVTYPNLDPGQSDIRIEGKLPFVFGNEALLTQCMSNLLGNAVKFVKPGTRPRIRVWSGAEPEVRGQPGIAEPAGGFVRVYVEDNGIGIPEEAQSRLFGLFQRITTEYEGTGLGLAIVRRVVEKMGGSVGVKSRPGQGSCFWVQLRSAPLGV